MKVYCGEWFDTMTVNTFSSLSLSGASMTNDEAKTPEKQVWTIG